LAVGHPDLSHSSERLLQKLLQGPVLTVAASSGSSSRLRAPLGCRSGAVSRSFKRALCTPCTEVLLELHATGPDRGLGGGVEQIRCCRNLTRDSDSGVGGFSNPLGKNRQFHRLRDLWRYLASSPCSLRIGRFNAWLGSLAPSTS